MVGIAHRVKNSLPTCGRKNALSSAPINAMAQCEVVDYGFAWRGQMDSLRNWSVVAAALVMSCAACTRQPAYVFPETAAREWETARNSGDADAMAAVHTEDAQILPPNAPVVEGRAAIRTFFRNVFESRAAPADFDERDIIVFGRYTYRQGNYSVPLPDGSVEYGKFIQLWKNVDGVWKLHRQMWSRNGPPLAAPADVSP